MNNAPLKLYVHSTTKRYFDYGNLLRTETGIMWSSDGKSVHSYESGKKISDIRARISALCPEDAAAIDLVEGPSIVRDVDMNPHGLI